MTLGPLTFIRLYKNRAALARGNGFGAIWNPLSRISHVDGFPKSLGPQNLKTTVSAKGSPLWVGVWGLGCVCVCVRFFFWGGGGKFIFRFVSRSFCEAGVFFLHYTPKTNILHGWMPKMMVCKMEFSFKKWPFLVCQISRVFCLQPTTSRLKHSTWPVFQSWRLPLTQR